MSPSQPITSSVNNEDFQEFDFHIGIHDFVSVNLFYGIQHLQNSFKTKVDVGKMCKWN